MRFSIHIILLFILAAFFIGCSGGGEEGNVGWVEITEPTTSDTYTIADTSSINISGETFLSPAADTRVATVCNCVGFACFFVDDVECIEYTVYDGGVTVTVTNEATGDTAGYRTTSQSGFTTHWSVEISLALNENPIQVRAEDELGNWGTDQIMINALDATRPTITATTPEDDSLVFATSDVTVIFSEAMDTDSITTTSFLVSDGTKNISGEVAISELNTVATFTPAADLAYDTEYTVTLTNDIQDPSGNALETTTWTFTTLFEIIQFGTPGSEYANSVAGDGLGSSYVAGMTSGDLSGEGNTGGYDAFLAKYDNSGNQLWLKQFGTVYDDAGKGIAVDAAGNCYIAGELRCDMTGSGYGVTCDVFLAKYDSSGSQLWTRQFGTDSLDTVGGVALDGSSNAYIAGETSGAFPGTENPEYSDIFLTKYDSSGTQLWITQFGSDSFEGGNGIAVDAAGNSYITGDTFGDITGSGNAGSLDVFLAKYDTSGDQLWVRQVGTSSYEEAHGVAVDSGGNSYVTGRTAGEFDSTGAVGEYDVFILKYDSLGNQVWAEQFGSTYYDTGYGAATDATGNIYTTGRLPGSAFISKHDTDGVQLWMKRFGGSNDTGKSIDVGMTGNIHASGYTYGDLAGSGSAGSLDAFIARIEP